MSTEIPQAGPEPEAATKLQILATEHWSLLATRSMTFNEALGRVTIFLAILSGALIALALVAQADHFGQRSSRSPFPRSSLSYSQASPPSGA